MNKIVSIVLTLTLSFMAIATATETTNAKAETEKPWYKGDVNKDGFVNAVDASLILGAYADLTEGKEANIPTIAADVNNDGFINAIDASFVLQMYAAASAEEVVEYEIISDNDEQEEKTGFKTNDMVKFVGVSWWIHTTRELGTHNIYAKKDTLDYSNVFTVAECYDDNWYGVYVDPSQTEVYVLINENNAYNFEKVGTASNTTTTTTTTATTTTTTTSTTTVSETTTTSTTTTTTTEVTTSTTEETTSSTTTSIQTTETSTTTSSTTTISNNTNLFDEWECVKFIGESWNIRSSPERSNNVVDYLDPDELFFIKEYVGDGWYKVCKGNRAENNLYVLIEPYKYLFVSAQIPTYQVVSYEYAFSSRNSEDYGSCCTLGPGDLVGILEVYPDGWAKIVSDKYKNTDSYILFNPFLKLHE